MNPERNDIFVIGAGFSAGLGYPLTSQLLPLLLERFDRDLLKRFEEVVKFHHPAWSGRTATLPNIEYLLTEWSANEDLLPAIRPNGPFRKKDLSETRERLLWNIATWFHEIHAQVAKRETSILNSFLKTLKKAHCPMIISFNWDYELDRALFGTRSRAAARLTSSHYGLDGGLLTPPALLKPHGSLNWYSRSKGQYLKEKKTLQLWGQNNTRDAMYCFLRWRGPKSEHDREYVPFIVPPTHWKKFHHPMIKYIWKRCVEVLSTARIIYFLGYSLPIADWHSRYIFRCGFHNQIDGLPLPDGHRARPTGKAQVVIVNPDNEAFRRIEDVAALQCEWVPHTVAQWLSQRSPS